MSYHPMLATQTLIVGDVVRKAEDQRGDQVDLYEIRTAIGHVKNGFDYQQFQLTRLRDGKRLHKTYGRAELVIISLTVEINGKVVPGREQWR
jgi:hypothetical protein